MEIACLDLEGVLVPEIWIAFAEKTGIEELKATTRDIPDYDVLMKQRLSILDKHGLKLSDIQEVIATQMLVALGVIRVNAVSVDADIDGAALGLVCVPAEVTTEVIEATVYPAIAQVADLEID